jgi:hypothetical protein
MVQEVRCGYAPDPQPRFPYDRDAARLNETIMGNVSFRRTAISVSFVGLYYPYINFRAEGWLKTAALYWDGISRIVPFGIEPSTSDTVRAFEDGGFLRAPARPEEVNPENAAALFTDLIAQHGAELVAAGYGLADSPSWPDDSYTVQHAPAGSNPKLAYVFRSKITPELAAALRHAGLAETESPRFDWVGTNPKLADLYMMVLANDIAKKIGARPVTSDVRDHVVISDLNVARLASLLLKKKVLGHSQERAKHPANDLQTMMASVSLSYVVPRSPGDIPAKEILKFRTKYATERDQFQITIDELTDRLTHLKDVQDPKRVEEQMHDLYDKNVAGDLAELQQALSRSKWETFRSALTTSWDLPLGLSSAGVVAVTLSPLVAGVGGLAFAGSSDLSVGSGLSAAWRWRE